MEIVVKPEHSNMRLDQFLKSALPDKSRAALQKAIKSGACKINGGLVDSPATKIITNQVINLQFDPHENKLTPESGDIHILWEDTDLAVCEKPAGLTVHPCPSQPETTLVQRLLTRYPSLAAQSGLRPGIVHRLDKDTSGLLLIALNEKTRLALSEAFAKRQIHKQYLALVAGIPSLEGEINEAIGRHPHIKTKMAVVPENHGGKNALTQWQILCSFSQNDVSLLSLRIGTGRTHQIRVHLSHLGYPILGDTVYAPAYVKAMAPRQMLHAWKLSFTHPGTGENLDFTLPPPEDFMTATLQYARQLKRVIITGNPGCGKSTFRKDLENLGYPGISADDIVANLYNKRSEVAEWLEFHNLNQCLLKGGAVDKTRLYDFFIANQSMRPEFEKYVHALVNEKIDEFWKLQAHSLCAIAEIPLYFECSMQKNYKPAPITVGIHCNKNERWQRLGQTRNWDTEKIKTIENWQLPESKKMSLCDKVISNEGSTTDLNNQALLFNMELKNSLKEQDKALKRKLDKLFSSSSAM